MSDAPLTIVQVIPSLVVGGAETLAVHLAEAQLRAGHQVWLLVLKHDGPLAERLSPALAARTIVLGKRSRYDATVLPRAVHHLRTLAPDVVHTHLFTSLSWGTTAARLAGVPVVVHTQHACHDDEVAWLPRVRRVLSWGVDVVVGCSPATVRDVLDRGYSPHAPVVCIDNGIPLAGRPRATLDHTPLRVGTVGRLVEIKGQRYLIEALARLRAEGVDVVGTIMGDGPLRDTLADQVSRAGLDGHVTFTGRVSDVADRLAQLDLFVLPSLSEALPMTLLEAGAAGLPMVVTTGGGGPTLLEAGAGGWAVPPADADALAEAIAAYAALDLPARQALAEKTRRVVVERYSLDATLRTYEALYREHLGDRGSVRAARRSP